MLEKALIVSYQCTYFQIPLQNRKKIHNVNIKIMDARSKIKARVSQSIIIKYEGIGRDMLLEAQDCRCSCLKL